LGVRATGDADRRIDALYRLNSGPLLNYLTRLTLGDRRQAEDILQETFLRAWCLLQRREVDVETLRPWLYTVARHLVIDRLREQEARPEEVVHPDPSMLPAPDDPIDRMLLGHTVRCGLKDLRPEHRTVLIESYYRDRSTGEIAQLLKIPRGTVKSRTHYALRALRLAINLPD
jgi:RNA polymerase sigma-70 factor (ECF subfamily)